MHSHGRRANHLDAKLVRQAARFRIEVIHDFQMIRHETERGHQHRSRAFSMQLAQAIQNIGLEPRLARWTAAALEN